MDPDQALMDILTGCRDKDRDLVVAAAEALAAWVDNGGFLPNAIGCATFALNMEALEGGE